MAKQITQFRYYKEGHTNNSPSGITVDQLIDGNAFKGMIITQLGIQTLPGVRFHLNDNNPTNPPIIIGSTGIYELEIDGISQIESFWFEKNSLDLIEKNENAYLIIDMIYEEKQED